MSKVAEELKRKISDRKFAIECLGIESEIPEKKEEFNAGFGKELLQTALENSQEAVNAVIQDGYHVLQSSKSSFWKKIDIFAKRVIRKLIYICFGFYIKPILNKQTVFNGKTINAVTAIQDWCFLKQGEIERLEEKWNLFERNNIEAEEKSQRLFSNLEEKINLLMQKNCEAEEINKELVETLKQKEEEIDLLKLKVNETEKKFLLELEKIVTEICELENTWNKTAKEQEEFFELKTDLSKVEEKLLSKFEVIVEEINKLDNKWSQSVKEQKEESFELKAILNEAKKELLWKLEWMVKEINKLEDKWSQFEKEQNEESFELKESLSEAKKELLWKLEQVVEETNKLKDKWSQSEKEQNEEIDALKIKLSTIEIKILAEIEVLLKEYSEKEALLEERLSNAWRDEGNSLENKFSCMFSEQKEEISALSDKITHIEENGIKELKENKGILSYLRNKFGLYYDLKMIEDSKIDYFDFENHFRGSRTIIKESQRPYIQYFQTNGGAEILDLGCGRGEFLELMYDYGIKAKGVDVYEPFVNYCKKRGFEVIQEDALTYLNTLPDASVGGIFMGQVLEHLETDYLIALIKCIYKKLKVGCYFIAETPNPENLSTYCFFYTDLGHIKPIPYLTVRYLLEKAGFESVERYNNNYSKYPIELTTDVENGSENSKLNNLLYAYQDYTIIAKK